jgi:ech hydrogenase subunit E
VIGVNGDSYDRCDVRIREVFQSIDLLRQAIAKIPEGELSVPVKGNPDGEYFVRIEQPRGEAFYYTKASGKKYVDRFRLRTPTFANLAGLTESLKGCDLADVPILIVTIDPCISCTER